MSIPPFHLAIPVSNLENARIFYREIIGCEEGRSSDHWVDFNFYGHQLVIHFKAGENKSSASNAVDGKAVPIPHFGLVLPWDEFEALAEKIKLSTVKFIIEPYIRFKGEVGEQATMFFSDPSGNAIEFKSFRNEDMIFAK